MVQSKENFIYLKQSFVDKCKVLLNLLKINTKLPYARLLLLLGENDSEQLFLYPDHS